MKLNDSNLADPLLLTGCALGGPPWGNGGPFGGQDLISTTTFPDDSLLLPATPNNSSGLSSKAGSSPNGPTGGELETLLIVQSSDTYAELKSLPPFDYGGLQNDPHLPQMGNNGPNHHRHGGSGGSTGGSSIVNSPNGTSFSGGSPSSLFDPVSSSTTATTTINIPANIKSELADYLLNSDIDDIAALIGNAIADSTVPNLGIELDPNGVTSSTIDPWTELDAWIESACQQPGQVGDTHGGGSRRGHGHGTNGGTNGGIMMDQDATIHTSAADQSFLDGSNSTLQTLLEADSFSGSAASNNNGDLFHHELKHQPQFHNNTSILQSRLQQPVSGQLLRISGPNSSPSQMPESTTHYGLKVDPYTLDPGSPTYIDPVTGEVTQRPHTTHVSPTGLVTSTMMTPNKYSNSNSNNNSRKQYKMSNKQGSGGPFHSSHHHHHHHHSPGDGSPFLSPYGSPYDPSPNNGQSGNQVSYASSSHIGPPWSHNQPSHHWRKQEQSKLGMKTKRKSSKLSSQSSPSGLDSPLDGCGKDKPIHRCGICSRGFLNKSNIKVHLRTHTGEKPFKCEVCGKAFRQKAHLLKHVQIHKRIQRD